MPQQPTAAAMLVWRRFLSLSAGSGGRADCSAIRVSCEKSMEKQEPTPAESGGFLKCESCDRRATFHISLARRYTYDKEHHFCEAHVNEFLSREPQSDMTGVPKRTESEVQIDVEKV